jgi:hypothetical protein
MIRTRTRLSTILAYPARPAVLGWLAGYAGVRLVTWFLGAAIVIEWYPAISVQGDVRGMTPFLLSLLVELVVWLLAMKLAVEALLDPEDLRADGAGAMTATDTQAGGQVLLLALLLGSAYFVALVSGTGAGLLYFLVAMAVLPAAILLLAIDESLPGALNPLRWHALVARLGIGYGAVATGLVLLVLGLVGVHWLASHLPAWLDALVARFATLYVLVAAYRWVGSLLQGLRKEIGLDVVPPIVRPVLASAEEDTAMREAEVLALDNPAAAAAHLGALIRRSGASAPVHARYRQWLVATGDLAGLGTHARAYAANLLALGHEKQALALVAESVGQDPAFALEVPSDITRLVALAAAGGNSRLAVHLATGFDTRFPTHPDVTANVLLAARLLAERLGRDAEAKQWLTTVARKYRQDPLAAELWAELAAMEQRLAQRPAG